MYQIFKGIWLNIFGNTPMKIIKGIWRIYSGTFCEYSVYALSFRLLVLWQPTFSKRLVFLWSITSLKTLKNIHEDSSDIQSSHIHLVLPKSSLTCLIFHLAKQNLHFRFLWQLQVSTSSPATSRSLEFKTQQFTDIVSIFTKLRWTKYWLTSYLFHNTSERSLDHNSSSSYR